VQIKILEDGEVTVKGPQVTAGYFDRTLDSPLKDGWLYTGDIGELADESLIILGRKKKYLKTSYGKSIYAPKIEGLLKEVEGVAEVMLVAESKPFCSALIWVDKNRLDEITVKLVEGALEEVNKHLANPEKVKRWRILENDLSVEKGDLTPILKLKRNNIMQRYAKDIEALYSQATSSVDFHIGGVAKDE
jgi:long-chain acyl-CoA synthetase